MRGVVLVLHMELGITRSTPSRIRGRHLGNDLLMNEAVNENEGINKDVRRPTCRVLLHPNQGRHSMNQQGQRAGQHLPFPIGAWQRRRVNSRNERRIVVRVLILTVLRVVKQVVQFQV
jgi:hypothetical protein